ncbi:hypothetical protein [Peribacillus frigoritolerans]|nr:hypothetical protein [Peribacillus frigoritolerans]
MKRHWIEEICATPPNNWLAETPQPLALMRLCRKKERISEIN